MRKEGGWAAIAETDDDDSPIHIVPVRFAPAFKTREACEEWVRDVLNPAGDPMVTDEDGDSYTYFGHTLSKDCQCDPDTRKRLGYAIQYLHRTTQ